MGSRPSPLLKCLWHQVRTTSHGYRQIVIALVACWPGGHCHHQHQDHLYEVVISLVDQEISARSLASNSHRSIVNSRHLRHRPSRPQGAGGGRWGYLSHKRVARGESSLLVCLLSRHWYSSNWNGVGQCPDFMTSWFLLHLCLFVCLFQPQFIIWWNRITVMLFSVRSDQQISCSFLLWWWFFTFPLGLFCYLCRDLTGLSILVTWVGKLARFSWSRVR